jgi:putative flippase GtrA
MLQFVKFSIFGIFTALVYFGIYLYLANSITPLIATFTAFIVAVVLSYFLNSTFVFTTTKGSFKIFILIALSGLCLNMLIVYIFTELIIKNIVIAGIIVNVVVPIHNYLLNYKINFK